MAMASKLISLYARDVEIGDRLCTPGGNVVGTVFRKAVDAFEQIILEIVSPEDTFYKTTHNKDQVLWRDEPPSVVMEELATL